MKTVEYFIRHGAVVNPGDRVYGRGLIPLSYEGRCQIRQLGYYLWDQGVQPGVMKSSPILRTRQSVSELIKVFPDVPLEFVDELQEVGLGKLVGQKLGEQRMVDVFTDPRYKDAGIEPAEKIANRVAGVAQRARTMHAGQEIFLVSHGNAISFGLYRLLYPEREVPGIREVENDFHLDIKKGQAWKVVLDEKGLVVDHELIVVK